MPEKPAPLDKNQRRNQRPGWFIRLTSAGMDFVFSLLITSFLVGLIGRFVKMPFEVLFIISMISLVLYYAVTEHYLGRSPGKFILIMKMASATEEELSESRMLLRAIVRGVLCLIPPVGLLSWERVTVLDWLTGTRVNWLFPPLDKTKRRAKHEGWR